MTMRAILALSSLTGYLGLAFGLRSWLHRRATGSWGFRRVSGAPGILLAAAVVAIVAAPVLSLVGIDRVVWQPSRVQDVVAVAVALAGMIGTLVAQSSMGRSWRIGVRQGERTELVTAGPFAWVRNPIFTFMIMAAVGYALALSTWSALLAVCMLVAAIELQVRFVEEPYLMETHGASYRDYCRRVGRFVPFIGRSR